MADINNVKDSEGQTLHSSESERLRRAIELLFFAYRDFTGDPDEILQQSGFGRAHHRVLHFIGAYPGISVAQLLEILKITKQSLARVLRQLVQEGFVEQRMGKRDRRKRLLYLTPKGRQFERQLAMPQRERFRAAFAAAGDDAVAGYFKVIEHLINAQDRQIILQNFKRGRSTDDS
ncbi:MAG TPA: MarR family transcriptional regulator [Alphaproteobacteria bacterium]|nr:MarR family transcriptional regulator [Alphaproteobacteria bacterium]HBA41936.1 MarR family transcriptional regulator [Alphaproteobacteria bacterium]HBC55078.1 MarR family transcriptional regulator [Alphaproteobacteria bacterium]HBF98375.1 MarR family transcriptional regulator [Alphaproteobacteria bacterium]HCO91516.1 MarR family transcriptional regulator [Alphaproteobacteria bacterium]